MAIQNRRGAYVDLNPAKAVPGELLVVQSGDPNTTDGKAVYITFASGDVKLLATKSDVETIVAGAVEDIVQDLEDTVDGYADRAETAASNAEDIVAGAEAAIEAKGEEVIESIPEDYTALSDDVGDLKSALSEQGFTNDARVALLDCFAHVAWIDEHGQDYYDALQSALYAETDLVRIEAVFAQGSVIIYPTTPLNDLKAYLTVTGYYNDGTSKRIYDYTLYGALEVGTSIITVMAQGKTNMFNVVVTSAIIHLPTYVFVVHEESVKFYSNNTRACSAYVSGEHPYPKSANAESMQEDYYPIPIPEGASSIAVTMPNDLYVGIRVVHWTDVYYITDYSSPWLSVNDSMLDISSYNDGTYFVGLSYKSGSEGTTDMTNYDMGDVEITFV